jgi:hypothetical protein
MTLWCGECGKACGRLEERDGVLHYVGRAAWSRTDRYPAEKRPLDIALPDVDVPILAVACSSGHWRALDVKEGQRASRSGRDSLTLLAVRAGALL